MKNFNKNPTKTQDEIERTEEILKILNFW